MNTTTASSSNRYSQYAWFVLVYLIAIILWGAWVRITGSGAGCGNHWPTCNGQVIPHSPTAKTLIEFTHRLSSGLSLPLVIGLVVGAFRKFPKRHPVRLATIYTLVFLLSESAVGAGLVKFELVADNDSIARAITASVHLINTFILCASAALAAWWSQGKPWPNRPRSGLVNALIAGLCAILLTSMSGAITALGDTLFPTQITAGGNLLTHIQNQLAGSQHFLVQLRIVHPIIAVLSGLYLLFLGSSLRRDEASPQRNQLAGGLMGLCGLQLLAGMVNIALAAPGWLQLVHLGLAVLVWVVVTLLTVVVWTESEPIAAAVPAS